MSHMTPEDPFLEEEAELHQWLHAPIEWHDPATKPTYDSELSQIFGRPVFVDPALPPMYAVYGPTFYEFSPDEAERIGGAAKRAEVIRGRQERFAQRGVLGTIIDWFRR